MEPLFCISVRRIGLRLYRWSARAAYGTSIPRRVREKSCTGELVAMKYRPFAFAELVAAQKEFYATQHTGYAEKILSDEGQHNGLYWRVAAGEPQSPIGPLIAAAVAEGYARRRDGAPTPYRGYYYRVLTRQGKGSPDGAKNYIVNGKMTEGFALLAYPAEYRSSGVMTFIVSQDGIVFQRDLGKKTGTLATAMKEYNPNSGWQKAEEQEATTAGGPKTR